jgi:hypothetical protein
MKTTVITNESGDLVALHLAQPSSPGGGAAGGLIAGPGQKLHEAEIPDDVVLALTKTHEHEYIVGELKKHAPHVFAG